MEEHLELISLNIWHIVAAILNLLILTLIVKKFLFERVQKVLAERKSQVDTLYTDAETAKTAAESERAEYEEKLAARLSSLSSSIASLTEELESEVHATDKITDMTEASFAIKGKVIILMEKLRKICDEAESITDEKYWRYPTYSKLLFGIS